jgi:hypothetical protein
MAQMTSYAERGRSSADFDSTRLFVGSKGALGGIYRGDCPPARDFGSGILTPQSRGRSKHCNANHPATYSGGALAIGALSLNLKKGLFSLERAEISRLIVH